MFSRVMLILTIVTVMATWNSKDIKKDTIKHNDLPILSQLDDNDNSSDPNSSILCLNDDVVEDSQQYEVYVIPKNTGFKSYMDYRSITSKTSKQYKLQHIYTKTGKHGIRTTGNRYCVALGSYFGADIGQHLDLILENGVVIPCVLADQKADIHTDETNIITLQNGCVSEFVVDTDILSQITKTNGDISFCQNEWDSPVVEIWIYKENVFDEEKVF